MEKNCYKLLDEKRESENQTSRDRPKSAPYPRLKNSKKTSKCQVFFYSSGKSKIFRIFFWKNYILKKWIEWRANVSQCQKTERGTIWGFSTSILSQNMKKLKKKMFLFSGKISQCKKENWEEEPFGIFQHPFCRKTSKKCRGGLWGKKFRKKIRKKMSRSAEKNWKGGLFGLARYGMLRGKTGKTILVPFPRPNGAIWHHNIL